MSIFLPSRRPRGAGLGALAAVVVAVATSPAAVAASGSGSGGSAGSGAAAADFALTAKYKPPVFIGHLVRGGLLSCAFCTTSVEPRYPVTGLTPGWNSNFLGVVSLNGFAGDVTLAVTGLPAGVSSHTATSVRVPRGGATTTPFSLRASSSAVTGTATVTVRAVGGGRVHTMPLPISIADALPGS
ncbi:MAG TPA: hypothetical protein VHF51_18975 [Solirubrobacteraceae bacterium]|nr:hypothetical protein [Solirubrobacteraceae bacterium]